MQLSIFTTLGLAAAATALDFTVLTASEFPSACKSQCQYAISLSQKCAETTTTALDNRLCTCGANSRNELMYCAACSISNGQNDPEGDLGEMLDNCGWNYADAAGTNTAGTSTATATSGDDSDSTTTATPTGAVGVFTTTMTSGNSVMTSTITSGASASASEVVTKTTYTSGGSAVVSTLTSEVSGTSGATATSGGSGGSGTATSGSGSSGSSGTSAPSAGAAAGGAAPMAWTGYGLVAGLVVAMW